MPQITIGDIVSTDLNVPGIFDTLMTAMEARLQSQFSKGRITGPDYATVYLGATTAILQQSIQFALTSEEAYQRSLLVAQQVLQAIAETALTEQKTLQVIAEITNLEAQLLLINKSILRTDADIALINQKKATELGQTTNISAGLVGKQQQLYDAQIQGFAHDASVKSAKVVADVWSVQKSTDPDSTEGLASGVINDVVAKMMALG